MLWFDDEATDATVVELRADDSIGLLCRLTAALERCELDVRSARVSSLGRGRSSTRSTSPPGTGSRSPDGRAEIAIELAGLGLPRSDRSGYRTASVR